ncbi:ECF transporter S component [Streptococcus cuniculipharyngis]|uniref:ECF transporter S component n=1 Tax=Streptococcus cuniculipharyngis TaxID=1562651 RepID=A0A5C5SDM3_9STRE|nr:ECF transporter S component [Streptococcus cuniculipharyngis]TWS98053.1 ECF transporter S component [Streptococcus cuniculipharyngis]
MALKRLSQLALLSAVCIILRYLFAGIPNVQPITAIFLTITIRMGLVDGVLVAAVTMLVTGFLLFFGPWVLWQILSYSLILCLWKFLCYPISQRKSWLESALAGLLAFLYGLVIDSITALFYGAPVWPYVLAGSVFNLAHGLSTSLSYPIIITVFRRFTHEKNI